MWVKRRRIIQKRVEALLNFSKPDGVLFHQHVQENRYHRTVGSKDLLSGI